MDNSIINIKHLYKSYGEKKRTISVLQDINLNVREGEFISIIGESGSGKTTLLNIIGTLDKYDAGEVYIDGFLLKNMGDSAKAKFRSQNIGFVFQNYSLIPSLNVLENILLPLNLCKKKRTNEEINELLEDLGIYEKRNDNVNCLSGGEKQRVAIARGLIHLPRIILADEPTGNLDSKNGDEVIKLLREITKKNCTTLLMVTHNERYARCADSCVEIRDGKLYKF